MNLTLEDIVLTKPKKKGNHTIQKIYLVSKIKNSYMVLGQCVFGYSKLIGTIKVNKWWSLKGEPWDYVNGDYKVTRKIHSYDVVIDNVEESFIIEGFWSLDRNVESNDDWHSYEGFANSKKARSAMMIWLKNQILKKTQNKEVKNG